VKVLGIAGWSGSGKTTLIAAAIPLLRRHGLTVSTVKHTHHGFDLDQPGKDSWRHREAGATEVLLAGAQRWALLHENDAASEPPLPALLTRLVPVDLVLVEGFKDHPYPKLEVYRPALGRLPLWPERADVLAVATDAPLTDCNRTVLPLGEVAVIVAWMLQMLDFAAANATAP
jgi:molybdopterin-guanine dinucleotide biosynthesis protein B